MFLFVCVPPTQCARQYAGDRCAVCSLNHYRMRGECIKCPNNAWMLILFFGLALIILAGVGYFLNKHQMVMSRTFAWRLVSRAV